MSRCASVRSNGLSSARLWTKVARSFSFNRGARCGGSAEMRRRLNGAMTTSRPSSDPTKCQAAPDPATSTGNCHAVCSSALVDPVTPRIVPPSQVARFRRQAIRGGKRRGVDETCERLGQDTIGKVEERERELLCAVAVQGVLPLHSGHQPRKLVRAGRNAVLSRSRRSRRRPGPGQLCEPREAPPQCADWIGVRSNRLALMYECQRRIELERVLVLAHLRKSIEHPLAWRHAVSRALPFDAHQSCFARSRGIRAAGLPERGAPPTPRAHRLRWSARPAAAAGALPAIGRIDRVVPSRLPASRTRPRQERVRTDRPARAETSIAR